MSFCLLHIHLPSLEGLIVLLIEHIKKILKKTLSKIIESVLFN